MPREEEILTDGIIVAAGVSLTTFSVLIYLFIPRRVRETGAI
jgi:hypothetical protein